MERNGGSGQ
jgi:hypothetical protein